MAQSGRTKHPVALLLQSVPGSQNRHARAQRGRLGTSLGSPRIMIQNLKTETHEILTRDNVVSRKRVETGLERPSKSLGRGGGPPKRELCFPYSSVSPKGLGQILVPSAA